MADNRVLGWGGFMAGMALALPVCVTVVTPAHAQTPVASCSDAYHAALSEIRVAKGDDLAGAIAALRAADPVLPGRWIYSRALFVKQSRQSRPIEPERVCVEKLKVAGRLRCVRFAEPEALSEPALPSELEITQAPNPDELRVLKSVNDLVEGRGAIPDVGNNGRYTWLSQRATSDLRLYISQPAHTALCAGGSEVAQFYANALKPLQKRSDDVSELVKKARLLAALRVLATAPTETDAATGSARTPTDLAKQSLAALTAAAVSGVVSPADGDMLRQEHTALAALQRAKPALILAQVETQKGDDQAGRDRVQAAGRAVRMIEAAAYTEIYAERYRKFAATVLALPREVQAAHAQTCTCGN